MSVPDPVSGDDWRTPERLEAARVLYVQCGPETRRLLDGKDLADPANRTFAVAAYRAAVSSLLSGRDHLGPKDVRHQVYAAAEVLGLDSVNLREPKGSGADR